MKSSILALSIVFLGVACVSFASADPDRSDDRGRSSNPSRRDRWKEALKKYDKDGDGRLNESERRALWNAIRARRSEGSRSRSEPSGRSRSRSGRSERNSDGEHKSDRSNSDRSPRSDRSRSDRGRSDSPRSDRSRPDRARSDRSRSDRGREIAGRIFDYLDKNDDGKLNADEFPRRFRADFGKADANKDGRVSKKEMTARMDAVRKELEARMAARREEMRRRYAEWQRRRESTPKKGGDPRGHGNRARREPDRRSGTNRAIDQTMAGDKNGDRKLNADEFPRRTRRPFSYYDANRDGYVTREELKKGLAKAAPRSRPSGRSR